MCLLAPVDQDSTVSTQGKKGEHQNISRPPFHNQTVILYFSGTKRKQCGFLYFPLEFGGTVSKERDPLGGFNVAIC